MKPRTKKALLALGLVSAAVLACNALVHLRGSEAIAPAEQVKRADCILVLGAGVWPSGPSPVLEDRLTTALELYRAGKAPRILVSGDHGRPEYDEPGAMASWLAARGVPEEAIFLDHAGFDTHSSMVRAQRVFGAERVIVVTQEFHLPRALPRQGGGARRRGLRRRPPPLRGRALVRRARGRLPHARGRRRDRGPRAALPRRADRPRGRRTRHAQLTRSELSCSDRRARPDRGRARSAPGRPGRASPGPRRSAA